MINPNPDETPTHSGACPPLALLVDYLDSSDSINETNPHLDDHIQDCTLCQAAIEEIRSHRRGQWINSLIIEQKQVAEPKLPVIPGFQVIREISTGGQGIVYFAHEMELNRPVALKFLKYGRFSSETEIRQLFNEGQAIAALEHPAIIRLYGMKIYDGIPFLIMEWADQGSLAHRLAQVRPSVAESLDLIQQITQAIGFAHDNGIIHRDLKPSNILMKSADFSDCRISDFGLARKFSGSGDDSTCTRYLGTPGFMAPEMISDQFGKPGPASDIFSIGSLLYLLITGRLAHAGNSLMEMQHLLLNRETIPPRYVNPKIPKDLQTICLRCLEKEPRKRYQSAADLNDDLQRFRTGRLIRARKAGPLETGLKWCRRNKTLAATLLLFWLTTLSSTIYILMLYRDSQNQLDQTRDTVTFLAPMAKRVFTELQVTSGEKERLQRSVDLIMQTGIESPNVETQRNANFAVLELADIVADWDTSQRPADMAWFSIQNCQKLLSERADELKQVTDLYDRTELDLAQALLWLGNYLAFDQRDITKSEEMLRQSLAAVQNVVSRRADPIESLGVLGIVHHELANSLAMQKKLDDADFHYQQSLLYTTRVLQKNPDNRLRYFYQMELGSQYGMFQWKFRNNPQAYFDYWDSHYVMTESILENRQLENWDLIIAMLAGGLQDLSHVLHYRLDQVDNSLRSVNRRIDLIERIKKLLKNPDPFLDKALVISTMDRLILESFTNSGQYPEKSEFARLLNQLKIIPSVKVSDTICSPLIRALILSPGANSSDYQQAVDLISQDATSPKIDQAGNQPIDQLIALFSEHQKIIPSHVSRFSETSWLRATSIESQLLLDLLRLEKLISGNQKVQAKSLYDSICKHLDHQLTSNLLSLRRLRDLSIRMDTSQGR